MCSYNLFTSNILESQRKFEWVTTILTSMEPWCARVSRALRFPPLRINHKASIASAAKRFHTPADGTK